MMRLYDICPCSLQSFTQQCASLLSILFLAAGLTALAPSAALAQSTGIVQGRVVDAQDGTPLPGANVIVKGTYIGVSTNQDGEYQLQNVPTGSQTLTVSYVSYKKTSETVEVSAGETTTLDVELESKVLETGEVVVTGLRKSQYRSVNQKKQAVNVIDALSADDIGNLPEKNVAEAVQRLPGIVMTNDRTEGRFVSIRGGAANLNNVTLNGNTLASTAGSRATALDLLPAEMVSNIEVTKALTPDMPANAIGGSINIETLTAFDRSGAFAFGSFRGLRHDQQVSGLRESKMPLRGNLTAGTRFGSDDDFGIVVSASGSRRDFTTSGLKGEGWDDLSERDLPIDVPFAQEQIVETHLRRRFAFNTSLDWRPTNQTSFYLRPYFTYTDEEQLDNELEYNLFSDPSRGDPEPEVTPAGVRFPRGFGSLDLSFSDEEESLWGGSAGFEHQFGGAVTLSASGTFSQGLQDVREPDGEFNSEVTTRAGGVADMTNRLFDFYPSQPNYVGNGANYKPSNIDVTYEDITENTYQAKADVRIPFDVSSVTGYVKTGGQLQRRDKDVQAAELEYTAADNTSVRLDQFTAPRVQTVQVGNSLMPFGDTQAFTDWFFNEACNPPSNRKFSGDRGCRNNGPYTLNEEEVRVEDLENDFFNEESVYAGYAMATLDFGSLTALAGARIEHTVTGSTRGQLVEDDETGNATTSTQTFENAYTDVLPSVHLRYEATNSLQFRAAWTNTIGRPDYDDLSAFREVEIEPLSNSDRYVAGIEQGNPNLQPYEAMNFDLTAEYYFSNGGLLSAAGFYKVIDNPIYTFSNTENNVQNPFGEGRTFQTINRSQERNANQGTVLGLETTYQQPFTFLPAPFNGLGINSNVTITRSEVDVPSREKSLPFFEQADLVYNVIPYFQKQGFEARIALNYRGDYLEELDDVPAGDQYQDDRTTIDVNTSYKFERLPLQPRFLVQVENLTNAPEVTYAGGNEDHLAFHYLSGRTVTLGLSASL